MNAISLLNATHQRPNNSAIRKIMCEFQIVKFRPGAISPLGNIQIERRCNQSTHHRPSFHAHRISAAAATACCLCCLRTRRPVWLHAQHTGTVAGDGVVTRPRTLLQPVCSELVSRALLPRPPTWLFICIDVAPRFAIRLARIDPLH